MRDMLSRHLQTRVECLRQALKMFKEVEKHFADFDEDQFDFHSYCIRKMTLRAYVRPISPAGVLDCSSRRKLEKRLEGLALRSSPCILRR